MISWTAEKELSNNNRGRVFAISTGNTTIFTEPNEFVCYVVKGSTHVHVPSLYGL